LPKLFPLVLLAITALASSARTPLAPTT